MEGQFSFKLKLSLEEIVLRKVVVDLFMENDILCTIQNFRDQLVRPYFSHIKSNEIWQETVEDKVREKVSTLMLPQTLKKRMMHLVRPIGYQIRRWKSSHEDFATIPIMQQLCWTSTGVIDNKKTAEKIVCLEALDFGKRYELASSYCLVEYIPLLWGKLSDDSKRHLYIPLNSFEFGVMPLKNYWAYIMKEEESELDFFVANHLREGIPFHQYAFQSLAYIDNKAATEYFFRKLANEVRDSSLIRSVYALLEERQKYPSEHFYFREEIISGTFCYLISLMSPDQQLEVLKKHPCYVLTRFLYWPWQDLFLDFADLMWSFLPESDYDTLTDYIYENIRTAGYCFPDSIKEFFLRSPSEFRLHSLPSLCSLLLKFSYDEDEETVKILFGNIDPEHIVRLFLDSRFLLFFKNLMMEDRCHLAELCIREAPLSKEDKERFKEAFQIRFELSYVHPMRKKDTLKRFFQIVDKTEGSY